MTTKSRLFVALATVLPFYVPLGVAAAESQTSLPNAMVLHAARLLDIDGGRVLRPGEVLVQGERIAEVGSAVKHPVGAEIIDLGDSTLLPGLIDALRRLNACFPGSQKCREYPVACTRRETQGSR